jgi:hypothetical protein
MSYSAPTDDLRALYAVTKPQISKNIADGISSRIPLLEEIKKAGNFKEVVGGGSEFHEPAIVGDSNATGGYRKGTVLNVNEQEGIDKFAYSPAFFYASIFMDGTELAMNAGDAQAVSLLESRIEQAKMSMYNKFDQYLCGLDNNGDQFGWLGLRDLVPDTASATIQGTGVDRTKYAKSQNQVVTTAIASATAWNTSQAGRQVMTSVYNLASNGTKKPTFGLMTRSIFEAHQLSLQANERFVKEGESANAGYPHVTFMVNLKLTFGDNVLAGHFYFLNPEFLKLKVLSKKNFKMGDFIEAYDQDCEAAKITLGGQFTTNSPRYSGVYTGGGF